MIDPKGFNELKLCRSGPMIYNKNDWPIGMSLQKYGEFSWFEVEIFKKLVKPGDLVIDVGANIGTHTVEFSKMAGFVIAFEPQRIAFQTLCANLALNNCTNVKAFEVALGREVKTITVPERDPYSKNNFGGVQMREDGPGELGQVVPLDKFDFRDLAFVKVDIEGMEADFLEGARATIEKHRPFLYMEADGAQSKEAISMLFEIGYRCWWSVVPLFNEGNYAGDDENVFFSDEGVGIGSINMLCIPSEKRIDISDLVRIESPDDEPAQFLPKEEALV